MNTVSLLRLALPTKTIDIVWLILGFDPHGFRVCNTWQGDEFTYVISSGILANTTASDAIPLGRRGTLCTPTNRRSFPDIEVSQELGNDVRREIAVYRNAAFGDAVYLIESTADEYVKDNVTYSAISRSLTGEQWARCASEDYGECLRCEMMTKDSRRRCLLSISACGICRNEVAQEAIADPDQCTVTWGVWLPLYRECVDYMRKSYPFALDAFTSGGNVVLYDVATRKLGDLPPHQDSGPPPSPLRSST